MGFMRNFGVPELLIIATICSCITVLLVAGVVLLITVLNKNKKGP